MSTYNDYQRRYSREWVAAKRRGETICNYVDASECRERVELLMKRHYTQAEIARRVGVEVSTIYKLRRGYWARVHKDTAARIMAIPVPSRPKKRRILPPSYRSGHVDSERVREHLEWAREKGISFRAISELTGMASWHLAQIQKGQVRFVRLATQEKILSALPALREIA